MGLISNTAARRKEMAADLVEEVLYDPEPAESNKEGLESPHHGESDRCKSPKSQ